MGKRMKRNPKRKSRGAFGHRGTGEKEASGLTAGRYASRRKRDWGGGAVFSSDQGSWGHGKDNEGHTLELALFQPCQQGRC